jgi:hypothetical protein
VFGLALPLAVIACCLAGAMGGYLLVRPESAIAGAGLIAAPGRRDGPGEARALGGMLVASHAGTAGLLGYSPSVGAYMALALALAWGGALIGRLINNLREGPGEGRAFQALAFEAMMALTLALPWWVSRNGVIAGATVTV